VSPVKYELGFLSQKTTFFIVTAVNTSNLLCTYLISSAIFIFVLSIRTNGCSYLRGPLLGFENTKIIQAYVILVEVKMLKEIISSLLSEGWNSNIFKLLSVISV
jgi:hypothetical protein